MVDQYLGLGFILSIVSLVVSLVAILEIIFKTGIWKGELTDWQRGIDEFKSDLKQWKEKTENRLIQHEIVFKLAYGTITEKKPYETFESRTRQLSDKISEFIPSIPSNPISAEEKQRFENYNGKAKLGETFTIEEFKDFQHLAEKISEELPNEKKEEYNNIMSDLLKSILGQIIERSTQNFPSDFSHILTGFGGDPNMSREQHRKSIKKTPVILIHENAANVSHPMFGWLTMRDNLKRYGGYQSCEIWAMDYLGENNFQVHMPNPVQDNIDSVRDFIDSVIAYLNVERVDIICHGLGGMMTTAYMRGFRSDGTWDNTNHRLDKIGTAVFLSCANYGLGPNAPGEFQTGGSFEVNSHKFEGIIDDTPRGVDNPKKMISPVESWKVTTKLDVSTLPPQIVYVAIIVNGSFIEMQNKDTGRLEGADCNLILDLSPHITAYNIGHTNILKQREVFDAFKGFLNKYPPGA